MKRLADGLYQLSGFPPNGINVYLMGDVIVDAATRHASRRILREVRGHVVSAHALTHVHADHQGASKAICDALGVTLSVGRGDVPAMEDGDLRSRQPDHWLNNIIGRVWPGPGHPVDRQLAEGDEVAGFTVLETPGHSAGHVSYWRESDRTLVCGDVVNGMHLLTTIPGLHEPVGIFTPDPERNRESIRRLGELEPATVCFGHGPPWRDTRKFVEFCRGI